MTIDKILTAKVAPSSIGWCAYHFCKQNTLL